MNRATHIVISSGELSGDQYGSELARELAMRCNFLELSGMGGSCMRAAQVKLIVDSEHSGSVMGFSEVLSKSKRLIDAFSKMKRHLRTTRPDLLVLIDFPDFNLRLARYAHSLGIRTAYFIPPKLWAWREGRVNLLKRYIDQLYLILPFEEDFYHKRGLKNATWIGHPLTHQIGAPQDEEDYEIQRDRFVAGLDLDKEHPLIALLPGSRDFELKRHALVMLDALKLVREKHPEVQACFGLPSNVSREKLEKIIGQPLQHYSWLRVITGRSRELMRYSDAGAIKSGTSNLEAALAGLPFVMLYRASALSAFMVKRFVKLNQYSLVNIIQPQSISELTQRALTPANVASELQKLLFDDSERSRVSHALERVRVQLEKKDPGNLDKLTPIARLADSLIGQINQPVTRTNTKELVKRVLSYLKPYRVEFLCSLFAMLLFGASDGAVPYMVKYILDGVFADQDRKLLYLLPGLLIIFAFFRAGLDFTQSYLSSRVGHKIVRDLRNALNKKILSLSGDFFLSNSSANLVARITSDVGLLRVLLTDAMAAILKDSTRIFALTIAALLLDPTLGLLALIGFPLGFYPIYRFSRKLRRLSKRGQEEVGSLSSTLQESVLGYRVVKAFAREEFEQRRFESKNQELTRTFIRSDRIKALTGPVNEVLATLAIALVILYGGNSVIEGTRTQGDFIAFLLAVLLLYDPFKKLSRMNATFQQGLSGAERVFEVLDYVPKIKEPENPVALPSDYRIDFEQVSFAYRLDAPLVLSEINLSISAGEKVALVGLSGAGKSTLVDLIPRFIDPSEGRVRVAGIDIKQLRLADLRAQIAIVGQHTFLFNDTIHNNIAYGRDGVTREQVIDAARKASAYEFITRIKTGFDTVVGEGGHSLSGGQRQRIAIARAILKDAPILILDEATASLDNKSEREIQEALELLERNRTCLIIAHRLSTVRNVDRIVVMNEGRIVEQGRHNELLAKAGEYAKLYQLQFRPASRPLDETEVRSQEASQEKNQLEIQE